MNFNTLRFAEFFLILYLLYLLLKNHRWQNLLLLAASYAFYCLWDWRFLPILLISTALNYYSGLKIDRAGSDQERKFFFTCAVTGNLLILGFFKYFNFFADNLRVMLGTFGLNADHAALDIILPLGISFFTFQAMSYPIDIYRRVISPTKSLSDFALFVAFFPQLIAGPIERAKNMLPQFAARRTVTWDGISQGAWLIFLGLYKKIVIADNLAKIAGGVFGAGGDYAGLEVMIATYAFAIQIYADFSGYSDMARGLAKLMGLKLMVNFKVPFFAASVSDFWQRWHISLTTWVKEYIFYPLALARVFGRQIAAPLVIVITWAIMGFWHGPAWKFILWGVYHGILIVIASKARPYLNLIKPKNRALSFTWHALQAFVIFNLFCIGILCFAVGSVSQVFGALRAVIFNFTVFELNPVLWLPAIMLVPLFAIEISQYLKNDEMAVLKWPLAARGLLYYMLFYMIVFYGDFSAQKYYYFQF